MGQVVLFKGPLSFVFTLPITRFELKDVYIFQPHQVSIVKLNTIIFFRESNDPLYYGGESGIPCNLLLWHSFNNQSFLDSNNQFLQRHTLYYLIFYFFVVRVMSDIISQSTQNMYILGIIWRIPYSGGQYLYMGTIFFWYWHFCGTIIDVCNSGNP